MAKKKLIFKEEYQRANKIALYNKTLGRHLKLTKDQILTMAATGRLSDKQKKSIFKTPEKPAKKEDK